MTTAAPRRSRSRGQTGQQQPAMKENVAQGQETSGLANFPTETPAAQQKKRTPSRAKPKGATTTARGKTGTTGATGLSGTGALRAMSTTQLSLLANAAGHLDLIDHCVNQIGIFQSEGNDYMVSQWKQQLHGYLQAGWPILQRLAGGAGAGSSG